MVSEYASTVARSKLACNAQRIGKNGSRSRPASEAQASSSTLSENQRNEIAKSKRVTLSRQAAVKRKNEMAQTQANKIAASREAALRRSTQNVENAQAPLHLAAGKREAAFKKRAKILQVRLGSADDDGGGIQFKEEPQNDWSQHNREYTEGTPQEVTEAIDDGSHAELPRVPLAKKMEATAKQKYADAAEEHKKNKQALKEEWTQRGARSHIIAATYQTAIPGVNYDSSSHIHEVINELRGARVETNDAAAIVPFAKEAHPPHLKMLLRNILVGKRCGYWSSKKTQKLADECRLVPPHSDGRAKLKRMLDGYHPDRNVRAWNDGLSTAIKVNTISLDQSHLSYAWGRLWVICFASLSLYNVLWL